MAYEDDDLDKHAMQAQLGITPWQGGEPTSSTMPVPSPRRDDPRFSSVNAPRVRQDATGAWELSEHGNTRKLQGNEVGDAQQYAKQFWENNPTGWQGGDKAEASLGDVYRQALGRDPDAAGLAAHMKNPDGFQGAIGAILGSKEAQDRRAATPAATGQTMMSAPVTSPVTPAAAAAPAARRGSWGNLDLDAGTQRNINQFSGFNADRALAGADDDSVKDAFQRWAGQQDFDLKGKTKEQIGDFYKKNLQSAKDYGLDIQDVQGEKILINTKERGPEWIDSVIGAGGDNPMFGWQAEYDNIGNAALKNGALPGLTQLNTGGADVRARLHGAGNPAVAAAADSSIQDKVKAEIEALIQGGNSPIDQQALLEQLQP